MAWFRGKLLPVLQPQENAPARSGEHLVNHDRLSLGCARAQGLRAEYDILGANHQAGSGRGRLILKVGAGDRVLGASMQLDDVRRTNEVRNIARGRVAVDLGGCVELDD